MGHDPTDGAVQIEGELVALDVAPQHGAAITDAAIGRRQRSRCASRRQMLRSGESICSSGSACPIRPSLSLLRTTGSTSGSSALASRSRSPYRHRSAALTERSPRRRRWRRVRTRTWTGCDAPLRLEIVTAQQALTQRQPAARRPLSAGASSPERRDAAQHSRRDPGAETSHPRRTPHATVLIDFLFAHVEARRQLCAWHRSSWRVPSECHSRTGLLDRVLAYSGAQRDYARRSRRVCGRKDVTCRARESLRRFRAGGPRESSMDGRSDGAVVIACAVCAGLGLLLLVACKAKPQEEPPRSK